MDPALEPGVSGGLQGSPRRDHPISARGKKNPHVPEGGVLFPGWGKSRAVCVANLSAGLSSLISRITVH